MSEGGRTARPKTAQRGGSAEGNGQQKTSIFERIFSIFSNIGDPEYEKKRLLRDLGKRLKKAKQRLYNPKKEQALPGMATFFYELYKTVAPAQNLVQRAESSNVLRSILIESSFTETQRELSERLSEASIVERVKDTQPKELAGQLKEDLVQLIGGFDSERVRSINHAYNQLMGFLDLVHFDYYFLLRKFDSTLIERNLTAKPKFEAINAGYVIEDLKDIWDLLLALDLSADWDHLFDVLKAYRDVEVVSRNDWKQNLKEIAELRRTRMLELIIKHIAKDPKYKPEPSVHRERIVDNYFQKLKTQTELTMQKIVSSRREEKIEQLATQVFGTASVARLHNYTDKANLNFRKKMLSGFTRVQPLNYVKAFLLDVFKKDVRDIADIVLIKGKWSTQIMSNQLSEALHGALELSDRLVKFDEGLGEDGDMAVRLRNLMRKSERDKSQLPTLRKALHEINETARGLIVETVQTLVTIGKSLRTLIEDFGKSPPDLILNWKELDTHRDGNMKQDMVELYKRLYYFIQLMQYFVKQA